MGRERTSRPSRHTDKDVQKLVAAALERGWVVQPLSGHAWGRLCCGGLEPAAGSDECRVPVLSTPGGNQKAVLERTLSKCRHGRAVPKRRS